MTFHDCSTWLQNMIDLANTKAQNKAPTSQPMVLFCAEPPPGFAECAAAALAAFTAAAQAAADAYQTTVAAAATNAQATMNAMITVCQESAQCEMDDLCVGFRGIAIVLLESEAAANQAYMTASADAAQTYIDASAQCCSPI